MSRKDDKESKKFQAFCLKVHERLTMMFDDNLHNKRDPIEEDIQLLGELYKMYDTTTLPWVKDITDAEQIVTQSELFTAVVSDKK